LEACCIAGFQTRSAVANPADLEIGDTAGLETCATAFLCVPSRLGVENLK
jgi:hypothetical protein